MGEISTPRLLVGLVLWALLLGLVVFALVSPEGAARGPAEKLLRFASESPRRLRVALPSGTDLKIGDPVLVPDPEEFLVQVGRVVNVIEENGAAVAILRLHPDWEENLREGLTVELFTVPSSASWILGTLLPAERREEIRRMVQTFLDDHGRTMRDTLWPEIRKGVLQVLAHVERELPAALSAQSDRWSDFFRRHRDGVIHETLLPVLQEVTLVLARDKFEPLMDVVGEELWDALPAWSIGWRYVWQKIPLTSPDQARARFDRYIAENATPILTGHADEAARIAGEVIRESLRDARVRDALAAAVRTMGSDPELGALLGEILNDVFLKNEDLRELIRDRWETGLGAAVKDVVSRVEPLFEKAVNSVILDEDKGINPRLSRVIRCRVLMKDGRWVLLAGGSGRPLEDDARVEGTVRDE